MLVVGKLIHAQTYRPHLGDSPRQKEEEEEGARRRIATLKGDGDKGWGRVCVCALPFLLALPSAAPARPNLNLSSASRKSPQREGEEGRKCL